MKEHRTIDLLCKEIKHKNKRISQMEREIAILKHEKKELLKENQELERIHNDLWVSINML